jgi:type II secretory pathway pseudopilin PulG
MVELVVVMGIMGIMASLLLPALVNARLEGRKAQCTAQLRQLGQAMVMYDIDHDRVFENYPDRLTHLFDLGYVRDSRIFVCPMDSTKAVKGGPSNATTLKPGNAKDDKSYWAERDGISSNGMREKNCSYLYEFSTRFCQGYGKNVDGLWEWSGSGFGTDALVSWFSFDDDSGDIGDNAYVNNGDGGYSFNYAIYTPASPRRVDRDANMSVSWQEAKFAQLYEGDVYTTGVAGPGDMYVPASWSDEPYFNIGLDDVAQHGYPRTWMPIVRCFWHMDPKKVDDETMEQVLNLAVDGNTFYSVPGWEQTAWKYGRIHDTQAE